MCMVLVMLGRHTHIHTAEPLAPEPSAFNLRWLLKNQKETNHQVLIKFQQNCLKQGVEQFALISVNFLILFGIKRNCLRSGRSWSFYLFIRMVIKQIIVIRGHVFSVNYV